MFTLGMFRSLGFRSEYNSLTLVKKRRNHGCVGCKWLTMTATIGHSSASSPSWDSEFSSIALGFAGGKGGREGVLCSGVEGCGAGGDLCLVMFFPPCWEKASDKASRRPM